MGETVKKSTSELILSAVYYLQRRNGLSLKDITSYVAKKQTVDMCDIKDEIQLALKKATQQGILSERRGLYRIEACYDDKLKKGSLKKLKKDEEKC